ncbi:MAG: OFA family MFS transporter [Anaerolineaceae bacterium]|nr:OFA family MFS transporter [Anaerolineaceae bacterium]
MAFWDFFQKERTIAKPGFNRWLVPPAALAIHLCIGMAYGFSVFWLPLSKAIGVQEAVACPENMSFVAKIFTTTCDWPISMLGWMYTLFFVFLGSSAAIWGGWLEHAGPRKAGVVSALCWCGGLVISALGVYLHQIWLLWLGSGVIGGIGLGLGYISPVSTLIKWFPDRRGMATGMAIMGFGGGAMIGAPLANRLMSTFASSSSVGVWQAFLMLAGIYFIFMVGGALAYRIPPSGWQPAGWAPAAGSTNRMITLKHVHLSKILKIPQFWLIWGVLCLNVTAGIGIIGMASPLLQEVFGGKLIGIQLGFNELSVDQIGQIAIIGASFTGLLSLFNIAGRILWASLSDFIGRKATYAAFFIFGILLYALTPTFGSTGSLALFVGAFCIIVSMYGGSFATIPAYLADMFGTQMVGAIHGRLLTAWSTAGVLGPVLVNYIREYQLANGVSRANAYDTTLYILAGLLVLGLLLNMMIKPVADEHFMTDEELTEEKVVASDRSVAEGFSKSNQSIGKSSGSPLIVVILAWLAVGIPLAIGFGYTLQQAVLLFG